MTDYETMRLRQTVQTMREACDKAERIINEGADDDTVSVAAAVLHELNWGFANASTGIESALCNSVRERERERYLFTLPGKPHYDSPAEAAAARKEE